MKEYNFDENKNMGETVRIDDIKLRLNEMEGRAITATTTILMITAIMTRTNMMNMTILSELQPKYLQEIIRLPSVKTTEETV